MTFEVSVQYQGIPLIYTATPFDENAYWMKQKSVAGNFTVPKLIFLLQEHCGWQSSCNDAALVEQLIQALQNTTAPVGKLVSIVVFHEAPVLTMIRNG
jgi:hypothetical protein